MLTPPLCFATVTRRIRLSLAFVAAILLSIAWVACGGDDNGSGVAASIRISEQATALAEPSVGGHVTFTLGKAPTSMVTITLTSSAPTLVVPEPDVLTFTAADWEGEQRVELILKDDEIADGTRTVELVATVSEGPADYLALDQAVVSLTVSDDDHAGFVIGEPSGTTTERGGTASFDLRLTSRPRGTVTVPLASEDVTEGLPDQPSLTFDETNWDQPKAVVVTGQDDELADGEQSYIVTLGPAVSDDAGYGRMSEHVILHNTDDETAGIVVTKLSGRSSEDGGQAGFNVSLASQPKDDVTLTVTTSDDSEGAPETTEMRFTAVDWLTPTRLYVTGVDDDVDDGAQPYDVILAIDADATQDDDYRVVVPVHLPVFNDDDDVAGVTLSAASGATTETGGTATFTIALDSEPTDPVKLTLRSTDEREGRPWPEQITFPVETWREPRTVVVTGVDDDLDDGTRPYAIEVAAIDSPDPIYTALLVEPVALENVDDEGADVIVGPLVGSATESGGQATFTVVLASQPSDAVTIPITSDDPDEVTVARINLVFTPLDWNAPQLVIVTGRDDAAADGPIEVPIRLGPATGSDTTGYAGRLIAPVIVTNVDNDSAGVLVSPVTGTATEYGGAATFTVALASRPGGDVVMPLASGDPTELAVSPASLTFTADNWAAPRTVTLSGVDDTIADGAQRVAVTLGPLAAPDDDTGYDGLALASVPIDVADDDTAGLLVSDLVGTVSEAGGVATFTVVLASRPTANVVVPISSSREGEATVTPAQLTFTDTNWSSPQTVAVKGVDDLVPDGNQPFQIRIGPVAGTADPSYRGLAAPTVPALNLDNDTAGIVVSTPTGQATEAGAAATFTVVLRSQPTSDVTLTLTSLDTTEATVSAAALVFTAANWNAPQSVRVAGVDDALADGAQPVAIRIAPAASSDLAYRALAVPDVQLTVIDNDSAAVLVGDVSGAPTEAGAQATFTVALASRPTANVVLAVATSLPTEGTVSPPTLVFTTSDWASPQTVTVTGQDDADVDGDRPFTVALGPADSDDTTGYSGMAVAPVELVNLDDDTTGVVVSDVVGAASENGDAATFAIALRTRPSAPVTIPVLATANADEVRVTPPFVAFGPDNWTAPQTVTVTGRDDDLADGDQRATIALGPIESDDEAYARLTIVPDELSVTNLDNDSAGVLVANFQGQPSEAGGQATFSVALRTRPAADVTIAVTSSDPGEATVSPAALVFTTTNWASPRLVIATGVDDATADGNQPFEVRLAATSTDLAYHAASIAPVAMVTLDDDSAGVLVGPVQGNASEGGGQAVLSLTLRSAPTADVNISLATAAGDEIALPAAPLTFTAGNWNAPQFVFVRGVDDALSDGNQIARVDFTVASSDGRYAGLPVASAFVVNLDDDSASLVVGDVDGQPTERGGAATFTLRLSSRPASAVTVPLASTNLTEATVSPTTLVIPPEQWNTLHTITVTGVDDATPIADGPRPFRVTIGPTTSGDAPFAGLSAPSVAFTNLDDDSPAIEVSAVTGQTREGDPTAKATFTVRLSSQPVADVTLAVASLAPAEGTVSPSSLVFTSLNWNAAQTVTASGVEDPTADGDQPFAVALGPARSNDLGYDRIALTNVIVVNRDNDSAGVSVSAATGQPSEAGGVATFTVRLDSRPTGNVNLPVVSSDPGELAVSPATVSFTPTNWQGLQTITVRGVDDAIADSTQGAFVMLGPVTSSDPGYDGLALAPVALTNQDDDTAAIIASTVSQDTTEAGGQASLTIVLSTQPTTPVMVPIVITTNLDEANVVPAGVVFTPQNWNAPQVVLLTGLDDAAKDGDQDVTVAFGPALSTDPAFAARAVTPASRTFKNLDNDSAGLVIADLQGTPSEAGGQATFWVALRSQPVAAVTVALASSDPGEGSVSPATLAFTAANWSIPRLVTVTGADDPEVDGHRPFDVAFDLSTSIDAAYKLVTYPPLAFVNRDDDSAAITVSAPAGHCTEAGGHASFIVSLTTRPVGTITVPLAISDATEASFSPSAALASRTVVFSAADFAPKEVLVYGLDDALVDGDQFLQVTFGAITAPADAPYQGLTLLPVQLDNHDDDAAAIVVSPATGQPNEDGGVATFTVVLTSSPSSPVTVPISSSDPSEGVPSPTSLTFDASNWNVPRTVTIAGQEDAIADGTTAFLVLLGPTASGDLRYHGLQPSELRLANLDDGDRVGLSATGNDLVVAESGTTQTFTLQLDSQPTANVIVPIVSSDPGEASASPPQLVFTAANWATPQVVTVRGVDDAAVDGPQDLTIDAGPAVSSDPYYAGLVLASIHVTNSDNDTGTLVASVVGRATEAGGSAYASVRLSAAPTDLVTVAIVSGDTSELTVAPPVVTFTAANWQNAQTVELRGVDDNEADGDQVTTVTLSATSGDAAFQGKTATVSATTVDDDLAAVILSDVIGSATEAGGTATVSVRLATRPTDNVVISAATASAEITLAPAGLTFTPANWASPQALTIAASDDAIDDGDHTATVSFQIDSTDLAYDAITLAAFDVVAVDDDTRAVVVGSASGQPSEFGGAATFSVRLATRPTAPVNIALASTDATEGTVTAHLEFTTTNWATPQPVTVTGVDDGLQDGTQSYAIGFTVSGGDYAGFAVPSVPMTTIDNDSGAGVSVRVLSGSPSEAGGTAIIGVRLNSQPSAAVTLAIASDATTEGTVSSASLTFDDQSWSQEKTLVVTGVDDPYDDGDASFTISFDPSGDLAYAGLATLALPLVNRDDDAAGFVLGAVTGQPTEAGGAATFTVSPTSRPLAGKPVTLNVLTSDDSEGTASSPIVFTHDAWGAATVTVTGLDDSLDDGDQAFTVNLGPALSADLAYSGRTLPSVALVNRDDDTAGIDVAVVGTKTSEAAAGGPTVAITVKLTARPELAVAIPVVISDPSEATASVATLTFPANNNAWSTGLTVTITGKDDAIADGHVPYQVLLGPAISNDGLYAGRPIAPISLTNDDDTDAVGVTVSDTTVATSETGTSDTFTVVLTSAPTANVSIAVASSDPGEATVAPTTIEFTPANWNVARTVTVTGQDDDIADGAVAYQVTLGPVSSADPAYGGRAIAPLAGSNADHGDTRGLTLGALTGAVTEAGGVATFDVTLGSEPTAPVTVAIEITVGGAEAFVSPASLVFTAANWNLPQAVRITGRDDALVDGAQTVTITADPSGGDYGAVATATLTTTNADDDNAAILVSDVMGSPTEGGGVATFKLRLGSQPAADVKLAIDDDDADDSEVTVTPVGGLTFTPANWAVPQVVIVSGKDDAASDGDQVVTLTTRITAGTYAAPMASVVFTNRDNDQAGVSVRLVSGPTTEAGGTATLKVRLNSDPGGNVIIDVASSDATEATVGPSPLTFTAGPTGTWKTEQTVTLTGVNDAIADGDQSYLVTFVITSAPAAYAGLTIPSVPLVNRDDDAVGVTVAVTDSATHETDGNDHGTVTVVLRSAPSANVDVYFTVADASEATASGPDFGDHLTFTPTSWSAAQTITLTGVDDAIVDGDIAYPLVFTSIVSGDPAYANFALAPVSLVNRDAGDTVGLLVSQDTVDLQTSEAGSSGNTAVFDVKLQSQPQGPVTVPITSSDPTEGVPSPAVLVFTPANWATAQPVTILGQNDSADDGDLAYVVTFGPTTSGDAAYAALSHTRTLTNLDDDTRGLVLGPTVGALGEAGGQATITVALATQPANTTTVTISADQADEVGLAPVVLTFTNANWNQPQTVTATGRDDAEADGDQAVILTFDPASSDGLDYDLAPSATRTGLVNTDDDAPGVLVGAVQGQLTEGGGRATFTLALTSKPSADVEITVAVAVAGEATDTAANATRTFTPTKWNEPQTIVLEGRDDARDDGDTTVTVSFTTTSDDTAYILDVPAVSLTNRDDDTRGLLVSPVSGQPTEHGGAATFTVRLASEPSAEVTLNLTSTNGNEGTVTSPLTFTAGVTGNWATPQTVTVTGQDDALADGDQAFAIRLTAAGGDYTNVVAPDVLMTNRDNDSGVALSVRLVSGAPTEAGGTATLGVRLNSPPVGNVSIAVTSSNPAEGQISSSSPRTFTTANWAVEQLVTVTGQPDETADGDVPFNVTFDPAASADPAYKLAPIATLPLTNRDTNIASIVVSKSSLATTEAGAPGTSTDTFTVALTSKPTDIVTIVVISSDPTEATVSPAPLIFTTTNWSAKTITVTGQNDDRDDGDRVALVNLGPATSSDAHYNGLSIPSVLVVNTDDDTAGITVTTSGTTTSEADATQTTITVKLATRPSAAVTFPVLVSDPSEASASAAVLSIPTTGTTWQTGVSVTLTGVDDAIADGPVAYNVVLGPAASADPSYAGLTLDPIVLTNTDNDVPAALVVSKTAVTTSETGATDTFTVRLASEPTGTVHVAITSSDATEASAAPTTLTFTPADWSIARTVTLTGVDDAVADGTQSATLTLDPAGANYESLASSTVTVTNSDDDAVGITRGPIQGALDEEGGLASFTLVLDSQPTGTVTVTTAATPAAEVTVITPTRTFTAANWNVPQLVQLEGRDDDTADGPQTVTVTFTITATGNDYEDETLADVTLQNADDDAAGLLVANTQGQPTETGGQAFFTVRLASRPTAAVTVAVGVDDASEATVSPANLSFDDVTWNMPQTVTVTGKDDNLADGNQPFSVTLDPDGDGYTNVATRHVPFVNLDDDSAGVTVVLVSGTPTERAGHALFRVTLNTPPSADVTIPIALTDGTEGCLLQGGLQACPAQVVTTGSLTFPANDWTAAQTFTIEGVNDFVADGNVPFDVVLGPVVSSDLFYGGLVIAPVTVTNVEDDDAVAIRVTPSSPTLATDESGSLAKTFTVVLGSEPTNDVVIALNPVNAVAALNTNGRDWSELALTPPNATLTFTAANWNTAQTVTVTGLPDDYDDDLQTLTLVLGDLATHRATTTDTSGYRFVTIDTVPVTVDDDEDDVAGITYTVSQYATEGDTAAVVTVTLATRPTSEVTLPLALVQNAARSLGTPVLALGAVSLSIADDANWAAPRTTTVVANQDCFDDLVDGSTDNDATVSFVATQGGWRNEYGGKTASRTVTAVDNDAADITVEHVVAQAPDCTAGLHDLCGYVSEAGGALKLKVVLATTPVAPVSVTLPIDGPPMTSTTLTYDTTPVGLTPDGDCGWTGTLDLTGQQDSNTDTDDQSYSIDLTATSSTDTRYNKPWRKIAVTHLDDDRPALILTPTLATLAEAGADGHGTCTEMRVNSTTRPFDTDTQQPTDLVLDLSSDNLPYGGGFLVNGNLVATTQVTLTGTNWNATDSNAVIVTVCATDDRRDEDTGNVWYATNDQRDAFILTATVNSTQDKTGYQHEPPVSTTQTIAVHDNDSVGITVVGPTGSPFAEGSSATFTVQLDAQPDGDVVVDLAAKNIFPSGLERGLGTISPATLTFTSTNWAAPQTVTVQVLNDDIDEGANAGPYAYALDVTVNSSATADTTGYDGVTEPDVSIATTDNDDAGLVLTPTSDTIAEGGASGLVFVRLASKPLGDVVMRVSVDDSATGLRIYAPNQGPALSLDSTSTLSPDAWEAGFNVQVVALHDHVDESGAYLIEKVRVEVVPNGTMDDIYAALPNAGLKEETVTTSDHPSDVVGIATTATDDLDEGVTSDCSDLTVTLGSLPWDLATDAPKVVVLDLHSTDTITGGTVWLSSLTFNGASPWPMSATRSVCVVDDNVNDDGAWFDVELGVDAVATTDTTGYDGEEIPNVRYTPVDDDAIGVTITPTATPLALGESGTTTGTFKVKLDSQPTEDVVITVTSPDPTEATVSQGTLTFTPLNWSSAQTVTVTSVNDAYDDGDQNLGIGLAITDGDTSGYNVVSLPSVPITVADDDTAGFTLTAADPATATEQGTPATITLTLNSRPTSAVTIPLVLVQANASTGTPQLVVDCPDNDSECDDTTKTLTLGDVDDWATPRSFEVMALDDCFDDPSTADNTAQLGATASQSGGLGEYATKVAVPVDIIAVDDVADIAAINVSPAAGYTSENHGTFTATVTLATHPVGDTIFTPTAFDGFTAPALSYSASDPSHDSFATGTGCTLTASMVFTGVDDAPIRRVKVGADQETDATPPIANASDLASISPALAVFGQDAWQAPGGSAKANWFARYVNDRNVLGALFGADADGLRIRDLVSLSYYTKRGNSTAGCDWWLQIYTRPKHDNDDHATWLNRRIINDFGSHTNQDWQLHTTEGDEMMFAVQKKNTALPVDAPPMTLAELKASSFGDDLIEAIALQTPSDCQNNVSLMDALEIKINKGNDVITGQVDFGATALDPRTVSLVADAASDYHGVTSTTAAVTNLDNEAAITLGAQYTELWEAGDADLSFPSAQPHCTPIAVRTRTQPYKTSDQSAGTVRVRLSSTDSTYGGRFWNPGAVQNPNDDTFTETVDLTLDSGNWNNFTQLLGNIVFVCAANDTRAELDGRTNVAGNRFGIVATVLAGGTTDETGYAEGLSSGPMNLDVVDNDVAAMSATVAGSTSEAGQAATVSVTLATEPTSETTVTISSADLGEVSNGVGALVFNASHCASGYPCTLATSVAGIDDTYVDGSPTVALTATATSNDSNYAGRTTGTSVTNTDGDVLGLALELPTSLSEGACGTATLMSTSQPFELGPDAPGTLEVALSSSDETYGGTAPARVTLDASNWSLGATFQVCATSDARDDDDASFTLTATAQSGSDETGYLPSVTTGAVSITPSDDPADVRGIVITDAPLTTRETGATDSFTVALATKPWGGDVTVTITDLDATEGALPGTSITFTSANWNAPQTVTVEGVDDQLDDNDITYTLTLTASGADYATGPTATVNVTNIDGKPGNGVRDGTEACDGNDLADHDCTDFDYPYGTLACTNEQAFNLSGCWRAAEVAVGGEYVCVRKDDNTVACWSDLDNDPVLTVPNVSFSQIAAGERHVCGLSGGEVLCWGNLDYDDNAQTTQPAPSGFAFVEIVAGARHNCARRDDKTVTCWGLNSSGQTTVPMIPPQNTVPRTFERLSAGTALSCGVRADNHAIVQCWGDANQSGLHTAQSGSFDDGYHSLASGTAHTCAIKLDGTLDCWGAPLNGLPVGDFIEVSAGDGHGCAIDNADEIACWGDDTDGIVSDAPATPDWSDLVSFADRACAIHLASTFGEVQCWGNIELPPLD